MNCVAALVSNERHLFALGASGNKRPGCMEQPGRQHRLDADWNEHRRRPRARDQRQHHHRPQADVRPHPRVDVDRRSRLRLSRDAVHLQPQPHRRELRHPRPQRRGGRQRPRLLDGRRQVLDVRRRRGQRDAVRHQRQGLERHQPLPARQDLRRPQQRVQRGLVVLSVGGERRERQLCRVQLPVPRLVLWRSRAHLLGRQGRLPEPACRPSRRHCLRAGDRADGEWIDARGRRIFIRVARWRSATATVSRTST